MRCLQTSADILRPEDRNDTSCQLFFYINQLKITCDGSNL